MLNGSIAAYSKCFATKKSLPFQISIFSIRLVQVFPQHVDFKFGAVQGISFFVLGLERTKSELETYKKPTVVKAI